MVETPKAPPMAGTTPCSPSSLPRPQKTPKGKKEEGKTQTGETQTPETTQDSDTETVAPGEYPETKNHRLLPPHSLRGRNH